MKKLGLLIAIVTYITAKTLTVGTTTINTFNNNQAKVISTFSLNKSLVKF